MAKLLVYIAFCTNLGRDKCANLVKTDLFIVGEDEGADRSFGTVNPSESAPDESQKLHVRLTNQA